VDALNAVLALLALVMTGLAVFVTRNHRHDVVCLGVPIAGMIIAVIPLARVMWFAHSSPAQIAAELSEADNRERPCGPRGTAGETSLTPEAIASIVSEARTVSPLDVFTSNVSSLALGVMGSFLASFLYTTWRRHVTAAGRRSAGGR